MRGLIESEHMQQEPEDRKVFDCLLVIQSLPRQGKKKMLELQIVTLGFLVVTSPRMVVKRRKPGQPMQINGSRIKAEVDWSRRVKWDG